MKVFLIILFVELVRGKVAPDYFPQCKRSDPEIKKCILDAVEELRPRLKTGIPEVGVPPLEPLVLPTLTLDQTVPNLRLKAIIKNMKALGGTNFKIDKFRLNLNNKYAAEVRLSFPKLLVWCDYDVRGSRLLTLDINGKGKLRGNFTGIKVIAKGIANPVKKDDVEYLRADKIIVKVRIGHGQIAIDDTERPIAATSAVTFFNASPRTVLDILSPLIEDTAASILKTYINKVLGSIPLTEILTD